MSFATTTIVGRIGRDPALRQLGGDAQVCGLSVAVSRRHKGRDGQPAETTTWWEVEVWGRSGEALAKHLRKGDPICCAGTPELQPYTDKNGQLAKTLKLIDAQWAFVPRSSGDPAAGPVRAERPPRAAPPASPPTSAAPPTTAAAVSARDDDEPPF